MAERAALALPEQDHPRLLLDAAATTAPSRAVLEAMSAALGWPDRAPEALAAAARAREAVARRLGVAPERLRLCDGGTAANAAALSTIRPGCGRLHVISQPTEHPSVLAPLRARAARGELELEWLAVDEDGRVDPEDLARRLRPDTALVSLMLANHETGVVQPVAEVARVCRERGRALLHVDAVQGAAGGLEVRPEALGADLVTLSGHKLHGPKGVGVLAASGRPVLGEAAARPAPSAALTVGLAAALEAGATAANRAALAAARDTLQASLVAAVPGLVVNGARAPRLPGHLSVCVPGVSGEALVVALDAAGIAASAGSACASADRAPSPVLLALGRPPELARGGLRLTMDEPLELAAIERVAEAVARAVRRLRLLAG